MNLTADLTIRIDRVKKSRVEDIDFASVGFSAVFSDHMFVAEYGEGRWQQAGIRPYGPITIAPSISALHYGLSVFEGLKAHKAIDGVPLLFRPRDNACRFQRSAARLAMPVVPEDLFLEALRELVRLDAAWVPPADVGALYVRPLLFSTDPSIRVKPAERCQFLIVTFPFGAYFSAPVDMLVTERYARAFPGGTGDTKPAGNYAPALLADQDARDAGFTSVLWLDAQQRQYIEECGVMNIFFVIRDEVVTPPLSGTILPGVTRDSVITLMLTHVRKHQHLLLRDSGYRVKEERIGIDEVFQSFERGELRECFGTGTAATVSHIRRIRYRNQTIELPPVDQREVGPAVKEKLLSVMTGRASDTHGWVQPV